MSQPPIRPSLIKAGRRAQRGQVLVFGLFVAAAAAALLFFVFNSGQLIKEKTKLVNTVDAAAYSASMLDARTLNFAAYGNRVIVANTVAIAQITSLKSWINMVASGGTPGAVDGDGNPIDPTILLSGKYPGLEDMIQAAKDNIPAMQDTLVNNGVVGTVAGLSDQRSLYSVFGSQLVAFQMLRQARAEVVRDVLNISYADAGNVAVDPIPLANSLGSATTAEEWAYGDGGFVKLMTDASRSRMLNTVVEAQARDPYMGKMKSDGKDRHWELAVPSLFCAGKEDTLKRRGKTWISGPGDPGKLDSPADPGYSRWTAEDELVEEYYSDLNGCTTPLKQKLLWGRDSFGPGGAGESGYSGIPPYFDLSPDVLAKDDKDQRMVYAIRIMRKVSDTTTSEAKSDFKNTERLNTYKAQPAGTTGEMVAVAKGEVFFRRDAPNAKNAASGLDERPNLFNPFWHARLADAQAEVNQARNKQGSGGI